MPGEYELWLPELVYPETPGQIDDAYLDRLYRIFERDFVLTKPEWPGLRFALKRMPLRDGYASTFWHLISEGPVEPERQLNLERCARLPWVRAILDEFSLVFPNSNSGKICWWQSARGGSKRILIATNQFDYLVVLDHRKEFVLLWTAYPTRKGVGIRLRKEYEEYWLNKG